MPPADATTMKQYSFTLLELLLVITMIAGLLALLLPALNQARERARAIQFIGNQRQLLFAAAQYSDDSGMFPRWVNNRPYPVYLSSYWTLRNRHCPKLTGN